MSRQAELRRKHVEQVLAEMPDYVARLAWPRAQIELHRRRALRLMLRVAKEYSPWYRERLRSIDPGTATVQDLASVPPMTRSDLMDHWDEIVIYPSLRLAQVEKHLASLGEDTYLYDSFHAVASTGSAGRRGLFVYDWDGWIASFAGCARWRLRNRGRALEKVQPVVVSVTRSEPGHIHDAIHRSFSLGPFHSLSAKRPAPELADRLDALRPDVLIGHPSVLQELAAEAGCGKLRIRPGYVICTGEHLPAKVAAELEEAWDAHVSDAWIGSEALPLGQSCGSGPGLHVSDDLVILEPVDASGEPTPPGQRSAGLLLTNLFNLALPLIRYELGDQVTLATEPCPCSSAYTLVSEVNARPDGRSAQPDPRRQAPRRRSAPEHGRTAHGLR